MVVVLELIYGAARMYGRVCKCFLFPLGIKNTPKQNLYLQASGAKQVFRGDFDPQDSLGLEMRLWVWKTL